MNLALFTTFYPYITGGEQNFLEVELEYLSKKFNKITLIPTQKAEQDITQLRAYKNIYVENEYAHILNASKKAQIFRMGLFSYLTYKEICQSPRLILKLAHLKRLLFFAGQAEITRTWLTKWICEKQINVDETLFYTYWFDYTTTGIALARRKHRTIKFISRAHGYDVYDERNTPPYWPCRLFTLEHIERLFPDSNAGTSYLHNKFPSYQNKIETARLGTIDPQCRTNPSNDKALRIVSCSRMAPVKRLDLLWQGIQTLAIQNPHLQIDWRHFGDGELRQALENKAQKLPPHVKTSFPGYTTQADLFAYYKETPVDVFVNVSQSEGTPVAVMEAISCGIPIVATGVGGNKEIVTEQNGILLPENPTPTEIAQAILEIQKHPTKREGSLQTWQSQYNADKNYSDFSERLFKIRS